jgi:S1-C subfamily serine protease
VRASATGFFVTADGCLLTCAHVVSDASAIVVRTKGGRRPARILRLDAANDLALLKVAGSVKPLALVQSRAVKLGETVFTVGFPNPGLQGTEPKLTKGEISGLSGAQDDPRHFQISVAVQPGNSGGPLLSEGGVVIGVVQAKLSALAALKTSGALPENVNYAVKSAYVLPLLESAPEVAGKLPEAPVGKRRPWDEVVKDAEEAVALVLVY